MIAYSLDFDRFRTSHYYFARDARQHLTILLPGREGRNSDEATHTQRTPRINNTLDSVIEVRCKGDY